ncbi:MAG: hypothetical protein SFV55_21560 [Haliscomenobacter sp.]|uniref:hypothetical protein n=1 Tax=Haliscomenobacter sp. TaxID=2717303 RepID=UPI0029BDDCD7|nr:hypothetical protein [Haliscomenobacter sp.]MDX2071032.1 hypothetical protein [Haliscomenobacter sp.]
MLISKDALWKGIIESLIDDFIWFFFSEYAEIIDFERGFEFLDTELQKLVPDNPGHKRHADKLIKAWLKSGEEVWFLIHVEVQGYPDPFFDRRMFEIVYRVGDKFQRPVTGLAIYTDWNRKHHFSEFRSSFMGSDLVYKFNTYALCDHSPAELSLNPNPFAAVMEAAWQYLDLPEDEQILLNLKLDLIHRLKLRNIPRDKINVLINFIKYIVPFTNSEIQANFEQDLITLSNADIPMGLQEAILADVKKQGLEEGLEIGLAKGIEQGIEQGIEIGEANLLSLTVPALYQKGLSVEEIAIIYQISIEKIEEVLAHAQNEQHRETDLEEE